MTSTKRPTNSSASAVPPARLFPSPRSVFETEVAVLSAGASVRRDDLHSEVRWIASEDLPDAPLWIAVSGSDVDPARLAEHLFQGLCATQVPAPAERTIAVGCRALADAMAPTLLARGFRPRTHTFFGIAAEELATGATLPLEPVVGDDAWRDWSVVERAILAESSPHAPPNEAMIERMTDFKRRQQRHTPPIRRFLARNAQGEPVAMIGYAPFAPCDLGFAPAGVLVRLRDVAVVPTHRRRGIASALLRGVAVAAIEECGATQVVIGATTDGPAAALYRRIGAREVGGFVSFVGDV